MRQSFEVWIRRCANRAGIDIHRYRPEESLHGRLTQMLRHHRVDLLLDVGANIGQFASSMRQAGYRGRIVSFEPLADAHAELERRSLNDGLWTVAPRMAIGRECGEVEINVSANSFSSSLLAVLPRHVEAAPGSEYIGSEVTPLETLVTASAEYMDPNARVFLKIDTQGYEEAVLDGAGALLDSLAGIQLELSLVPLYEGQALLEPLLERLARSGFAIWGFWSGIHDPASGRMLQVDATLFREST